jgi:hypothetical protein
MTKVRQNLTGTATTPIISPVLGGVRANSGPVKSILRGQDSVLLNGRRVICSQSLDQDAFGFPDEVEALVEDRTHHSPDAEREVLSARAHITPGHFLRVGVLALPSGQTQVDTSDGHVPAGAQGRIVIEVTWRDRDGATETTEHGISIPGSTLEAGGLPTAVGGLWGALRTEWISIIAPPGHTDNDELARWSKHVAADIVVKHIGGVRVVDFAITEVPYGFALDTTDEADYWVSGINAGLDFTHPLQRRAETGPDPRAGTWTMLDVAHAQADRLGPVLLSWTAWNETTSELDIEGLPRVSTTSTSFVGLLDGIQGAYFAPWPGWSFSAGAYARRWAENHPLAMHARDGSIPVRVWVLGEPSTGSGTVRLQTAPWSWVDVTINSTLSWHKAYGHLRVGRGPGDDVVAQAFIRKLTSGTLYVHAILVEYAGTFESAV